jgi:hypothetical protein
MRIMQEQKGGSIVNVTSTLGHRGTPGAALYVASKHAVEGLTQSVALEGASFGVRVNSVAPGPTDTGMLTRVTGTQKTKPLYYWSPPQSHGKPWRISKLARWWLNNKMKMKTQPSFIDLTQRPPRSFRVRLGGFVILARMLDKGRATLSKKNGAYNYNSPTDQHLVRFLGFDADAMLKELAAGKGDGEMLEWVQFHSKTPRAPWEIEAWSSFMERRGPDSDAETIAGFGEYVGQHTKRREDIKTWFEAIELDDYVTFGGKAWSSRTSSRLRRQPLCSLSRNNHDERK